MPRRTGAEHTDVGIWIAAVGILLAALIGLMASRRRALRRAAEARARARARRYRAPLVSANLRPQVDRKPDIWREAREDADRVA
jgi:LPXTG-motif cell wall-anchored protein